MLATRFWSDAWVRKLNALDRYLFIYLLTNEHTTISGIYELPLDLMAVETGIDKNDLEKSMLDRLEPKVHYIASYIIIPNFPKHQNLQSPDVVKGIKREFETLDYHLQEVALTVGWGDGLGMVSDTKPNLTKPNLTFSSVNAEKTMKKNSMGKYREDAPSDSFEEVVDADTGLTREEKKIPRPTWEIISWAEKRMGHNFATRPKQAKMIAKLFDAKFTAEQVRECWERLEKDEYWAGRGIDFAIVLNEISKGVKVKKGYMSFVPKK